MESNDADLIPILNYYQQLEQAAPPEKSLLTAIIERAVLDCKAPTFVVRSKALNWLTSASEKEWSFIWCCEQLDNQELSDIIRKKVFNRQFLIKA